MHAGKIYYSFKHVQDQILKKEGRYRYLIKLDDDSFLHIPNLYNFMHAEVRVLQKSS